MALPPQGSVTLLFTDIEGSTALWEHFGERFVAVLALHDAVIRAALERFSGYEVSTAGDSFFCAFGSADDALRCCLAIQNDLLAAPWPSWLTADEAMAELTGDVEGSGFCGVRVRMGLHTGEPWIRVDPTTGRTDYGGPATNRTARVSSAAHGGQLLVSDATWIALGGELPTRCAVVDLGEHALKGLAEPETLRQLLPAALAHRRFAPIQTVDLRKTNVTSRHDSFVGRADELAALGQHLDDGARLVTLLGPGGTGKTRLAEQLARTQLGAFSGGAWFCDLTAATSIDGIVTAVGRALDVRLTADDAVGQLALAIARKGDVLIVLDNLEQIVQPAVEALLRWRSQAERARFVVTSRTRLALPGEQVVTLTPLGIDAAMQLFEDRAKAANPGFSLTPANRDTVCKIVERLDRMSLPIELAAARAKLFSPQQLLGRLDQRFRLLRGRRADHGARQNTLRGAIDWSWRLLEPHDQLALVQCSVFRDGFDFAAAEAVVDASVWPDAPWPEDLLQSLIDQSLLLATEPRPGHRRLRMYQSIRAYAFEKLSDPVAVARDGVAQTGPEASARAHLRHAQHYASFASDAFVSSLTSHGGEERRWQLSFELDNLVAAFEATAVDHPQTAALCALATGPVFEVRGPFSVGVTLLSRARALVGITPETASRLDFWLGLLTRFGGHLDTAERHFRAALQANIAVADERGQGILESQLGILRRERGDYDGALGHYDAAIALHRKVGNRHGEGIVLASIGLMQYERGDAASAASSYEAALQIQVEVGDVRMQGRVLGNLGLLNRESGDLAGAKRHYERALAIAEEVGDRLSEGITLGNLGDLALERGDDDSALELLERAVPICDETLPTAAGAFRGSLGHLQGRRGRLVAAFELFERGAEQLRGRHALELGKLLCKQAAVHWQAGDPDAARKTVDQIAEIADSTGAQDGSVLRIGLQRLETMFADDVRG